MAFHKVIYNASCSCKKKNYYSAPERHKKSLQSAGSSFQSGLIRTTFGPRTSLGDSGPRCICPRSWVQSPTLLRPRGPARPGLLGKQVWGVSKVPSAPSSPRQPRWVLHKLPGPRTMSSALQAQPRLARPCPLSLSPLPLPGSRPVHSADCWPSNLCHLSICATCPFPLSPRRFRLSSESHRPSVPLLVPPPPGSPCPSLPHAVADVVSSD